MTDQADPSAIDALARARQQSEPLPRDHYAWGVIDANRPAKAQGSPSQIYLDKERAAEVARGGPGYRRVVRVRVGPAQYARLQAGGLR